MFEVESYSCMDRDFIIIRYTPELTLIHMYDRRRDCQQQYPSDVQHTSPTVSACDESLFRLFFPLYHSGDVIVCFCFTQAAVKKPQGLSYSFRRTEKKKKKNILLLKILYSAHPSVHVLPSTLNTYVKLFSPGLCTIQR